MYTLHHARRYDGRGSTYMVPRPLISAALHGIEGGEWGPDTRRSQWWGGSSRPWLVARSSQRGRGTRWTLARVVAPHAYAGATPPPGLPLIVREAKGAL